MEKDAVMAAGAEFMYKGCSPVDIFTPEDFTGEHKMIANTAKRFIEKEVLPCKEEIENQNFVLLTGKLRAAGDLGLLAHSIPEEFGGLALDKISKGIVGEMVGGSGSYGVAHSNHTCIATLPITYFGTSEQKEKYLPKLASGEYIGAYCLTEPAAGSDALSSQTTARLNTEGTHYILNGTKIYITNAAFSDTFIVYAKIDGTQFSAFIVEKDFPGFQIGPEENKMGIKGSSTCSVILEDCRVPVENLLGRPGEGRYIALNVLNLGRFNLGSACVGAAKAGLKKAIQFTEERIQFGKAIAEFGATKEKIARMAARIYAAESIQYRTAGLLEGALGGLYGEKDKRKIAAAMSEFAAECAICKVYGSETLDFIADETLQLFGGAGFIKDYGIEQMYRDSRINRIFEGTNEINRLLIPGNLFKKVLKKELDLESLSRGAMRNFESSEQRFSGEHSRELEAAASIRDVFILMSGAALKAFGSSVFEEQETAMRLADLSIELYAAESLVLRTCKATAGNGSGMEENRIHLMRISIEEALWNTEKISRSLCSELLSGQEAMELKRKISAKLSNLQPAGKSFERYRETAENQYKKGEFACS
ncbi:acyl-CoA dehydrogenase family protein [Peribacillus sp. SCS-26]|uniref:acyl-CoA dehydrogenase family protein n=1 Tax=Paraperibacillus marinus TaxID=3115295 RepID=UPI00390691D1